MDFLNLTLIGIGIFIIISIKIFIYFTKKSDKKTLSAFKKNAIKIPVNLSDIKIISNSWTEEIEKYTSKNDAGIILFNKFTSNDQKNVDYVDVNLNRLIYHFEYDRKKYLYSSILDMEREKLKIWFGFHKQTYIYLNPKTEEMYLDLEFMNE